MTAEGRADDFEAALQPIWARAHAGDEAAYRLALRIIATRLRSYLRRRMQSLPDEVEDLVQETLLAIHIHRGTYDPEVPAARWVLAIARHKLIDLWRRRGRRDALHDSLDDLADADQPAVSDELPTRRDVETLLAKLPAAQRTAITLIKLDGMSVAEASLLSGVSVAALKVQVHRGLKRLAALVRQTP
jgi:RNA polymerase sigma-70 factor (ECF subfamily)